MPVETSKLWERVIEAFGTQKVSTIAEKLGLKVQALYKWQKGTVPDLETLVKISDSTSSSIHWLLTGEGSRSISRSLEITDEGIIGEFEVEEIRAIQELASESGGEVTEVIHVLASESLMSRGLLREPPAIQVISLQSYSDEERTLVPLQGEIHSGFTYKLFTENPTVQIPRYLRINAFDGTEYHPNHIFAVRISTDDLVEEGLHENDLVVCISMSMSPPPQIGQAVAAKVSDQETLLIRRFYPDALVRFKVAFLPIRGKRSPVRLKAPEYQLIGIVAGIITP